MNKFLTVFISLLFFNNFLFAKNITYSPVSGDYYAIAISKNVCYGPKPSSISTYDYEASKDLVIYDYSKDGYVDVHGISNESDNSNYTVRLYAVDCSNLNLDNFNYYYADNDTERIFYWGTTNPLPPSCEDPLSLPENIIYTKTKNVSEKECNDMLNTYDSFINNDPDLGYGLIYSVKYYNSSDSSCPSMCLYSVKEDCYSSAAVASGLGIDCESHGYHFSDFTANVVDKCVVMSSVSYKCLKDCISCSDLKSSLSCDNGRSVVDFQCSETSSGCSYDYNYACSYDNIYDTPNPIDDNGSLNLDYVIDLNSSSHIDRNHDIISSFEPDSTDFTNSKTHEDYQVASHVDQNSSDLLNATNENGSTLKDINHNLNNMNSAIVDMSVSSQRLNSKEESLVDRVLDFSVSDAKESIKEALKPTLGFESYKGFSEGVFSYSTVNSMPYFSYSIDILGKEYVYFSSDMVDKYFSDYIPYLRIILILFAIIAAGLSIFGGM